MSPSAGLRRLAGIVAGVVVFEGLDLIGSSPAVSGRLPFAAALPAISPFVAGAAAGWVAAPEGVWPLLAAAAAVWARIGVDRVIGALEGAHPPAEAGIFLVLVFGIPWTLQALAGGGAALLGRWVLRRRPSRGRSAATAPRRG